MDTGRGRRDAAAALGCALVLPLLGGCSLVSDVLGEPAVFESAVEPVDVSVTAPAYVAETRRGLLVRHGDDQVVVPRASSSAWLPGGKVLVTRRHVTQVVDPASGLVGPRLRTWYAPTATPTSVNVLREGRLAAYDLELGRLGVLELPTIDLEDLTRGYYGLVPTLGDVTWVQWSDYNPDGEDHPDGDRGLLRVEGTETTETTTDGRIVDLLPTPDAAALLAVRQVTGEDCGGCIVPQEVVELDPDTGEVVRDYGMPPGYDDLWRVQAVDKVDDVVAVRFEGRNGTWTYDGSWELVEGSEDVATWWQGPDDRIEVAADGTLTWVGAEDETPLPGRAVTVAGRLLPPAG